MSEARRQQVDQLIQKPEEYFKDSREIAGAKAKADVEREMAEKREAKKRTHSASEGLGRRVISAVIERK